MNSSTWNRFLLDLWDQSSRGSFAAFWQWEAFLLANVALIWAGSALIGKVIGR